MRLTLEHGVMLILGVLSTAPTVAYAQGTTAAWLDQPKIASWNTPGQAIPAAPKPQDPVNPSCRNQARPAQTAEDKQVSARGWDLVGAFQGGWQVVVVRGAGHDDNSLYYGPFMGATGVGDAVRELNDVLGLRDCAIDQRMHFADQPELFDIMPRTPGCIRHEVKKCLGPCVGGCTVQQYDERVHLARAFLDGTDDGPIERLRSEMAEASERLEYERAAALTFHRAATSAAVSSATSSRANVFRSSGGARSVPGTRVRCPRSISSFSAMTNARASTFFSSRTLPGHA